MEYTIVKKVTEQVNVELPIFRTVHGGLARKFFEENGVIKMIWVCESGITKMDGDIDIKDAISLTGGFAECTEEFFLDSCRKFISDNGLN